MKLVNDFQSNCAYSCVQSYGVTCTDNVCKAVTQQPLEEPKQPNPDGNTGAACETDADCATPFEYLARSSCPFGSVCEEGKCVVVCAMMEHDPDQEISKSWPVSCITSADCDCGNYVAGDAGRCACISDACYAVVAE